MLPIETTRLPAKFGEGIHGVKASGVQQSQQQQELPPGLTHSSLRQSVPPARRCEPPSLTWRWRRKLCYLHQDREGSTETAARTPKQPPKNSYNKPQPQPKARRKSMRELSNTKTETLTLSYQRNEKTHFEKASFLLFSLLISSRVLFL